MVVVMVMIMMDRVLVVIIPNGGVIWVMIMEGGSGDDCGSANDD